MAIGVAEIMSEEQEIEKLAKYVKKEIVGYYAPESTRWRRNYNDCAWWYWIWKMNGGKLD